jgi:ABC-2 type transport system permease protein
MNLQKTFLVLKFEFLTTIKRRSVLVLLFGLPLLSVLIITGLNFLAQSQSQDGTGETDSTGPSFLEELTQGPEDEPLPDGVVDQTGLLSTYPEDIQPYLESYPDTESAETAYQAEEIKGYFLIPADYLETGQVDYFAETRPISHPEEYMLLHLLAQNLIADTEIAPRVVSPSAVQQVDLSLSAEESQDADERYLRGLVLGIGLAMLFYLSVMGTAGYLLQSLGKEKQNRVMEILLSSSRPLELLTGKMLGLGAVGLVQLIIWSLIVFVFLGPENSFFGNIEIPRLEPATWLQVLGFFIAGYLVYGSLFASLGAITPGAKESSQYTFFLMLPTFLPVWFNSIILTAPNQAPAVIMSLFPLTSPVAMPMRLAGTAVPVWQWTLSLVLALLTAVVMLYLATRFFRSQTLLSAQDINPRRILQAIRGN